MFASGFFRVSPRWHPARIDRAPPSPPRTPEPRADASLPLILLPLRHAYATRSNKIRKLRTPGGKLSIQYVKKKTKGPQTPSGDHGRIHGIPRQSQNSYSNKHMAKNKKSVTRSYGGVLSGGAVRERIVRAFLVEEQKIVKKVLKLQAAKK